MILKCNNINKDYGDFTALSDINITFDSGTIIGLLGPNGSGKTTLIKAINSLTPIKSGEILFENEPINHTHDKYIAYLPDLDFVNNSMNARKLCKYFADFYDDFDSDKFYKMIKSFDLPENKPLKSLSRGMRKKMQIALIISRKAKIYFLDEPLAGVDLVARTKVINEILENYNKNSCLVISTHLINEVENILDRVIFLKDGQIVIDDNCEKIRVRKNISISNLYMEVYNA